MATMENQPAQFVDFTLPDGPHAVPAWVMRLRVLVERQAAEITELHARVAAMGRELGGSWASAGDDGPALARRHQESLPSAS